MRDLLILTELGDSIGFGHYSRCGALKRYFISKNILVRMLVLLQGKLALHFPGDEQVVDWLSDWDWVKEMEGRYESVLIDSYLADQAFYTFLKQHFEQVIAIDDYDRLPYPADIILNPNIFGNKLGYQTQAKVLTGRECVILREAFRCESNKLSIRPAIGNILITLGGSDYRKLCPSILSWLKEQPYHITLIAGSESYAEDLKKLFHLPQLFVLGYIEAAEMVSLMLQTDLAISACGQTLHELAFLGVPTIGICIDIDQVLNRDEYLSAGFLTEKLDWDDPELERKCKEVLTYLSDQKVRTILSEIGMNLINGRGIETIYHTLFPITS